VENGTPDVDSPDASKKMPEPVEAAGLPSEETAATKQSVGKSLAIETAAIQSRNLPRVAQLREQIEAELTRHSGGDAIGPPLPPPSKGTASHAPSGKSLEMIRRQLETARELSETLDQQVHSLQSRANKIAIESTEGAVDPEIVERWESLMTTLQSLRRLFFSVIEHLRETAEQQQRLNDDTAEILGSFDPEQGTDAAESGKAEPLVPQEGATETSVQHGALSARQAALHDRAKGIAEAIREIGNSGGSVPSRSEAGEGQPDVQERRQKIEQAAAAVESARQLMRDAAASIRDPKSEPKVTSNSQAQGLTELRRALALLQSLDPSSKDQNEQQQAQRQQQESASSEQAKEKQEPINSNEIKDSKESEAEGQPGMERLLQLIRDRDARRQQDRAHRSRGQEPVDRDW
jgi:hypothetical protein